MMNGMTPRNGWGHAEDYDGVDDPRCLADEIGSSI